MLFSRDSTLSLFPGKIQSKKNTEVLNVYPPPKKKSDLKGVNAGKN
jgi:hypothetical protein